MAFITERFALPSDTEYDTVVATVSYNDVTLKFDISLGYCNKNYGGSYSCSSYSNLNWREEPQSINLSKFMCDLPKDKEEVLLMALAKISKYVPSSFFVKGDEDET